MSIADREEKGSDVNVATHLLTDVCEQEIDAAVVISNDSDLALPIKHARARVPVGTVHPGTNYPTGALSGNLDDGVGGHWWRQLPSPTTLSISCPTLLVGIVVPHAGDDHAL